MRIMSRSSPFIEVYQAIIQQVYHPGLCPETVGLFHTPASTSRPVIADIQVAILGNPEFWKKKESQTKKEWLSSHSHVPFPRVFEDILFGSSFAIIGHQSHIDHYDELPQTSTLQLLEIQTFEKLSQINWIAQMKSLTGKTSHVTFPETVAA